MMEAGPGQSLGFHLRREALVLGNVYKKLCLHVLGGPIGEAKEKMVSR